MRDATRFSPECAQTPFAMSAMFGGPQPETFILGLAHGVMWIVMSLLCIDAARRHVIPFWLAVVVAVIGGLGPFAGSAGFVVADRHRSRTTQYSE